MSTTNPGAGTPKPSMKRYYTFFTVLSAIALLAVLSNLVIRRGPVHDAQAAGDIRNLQTTVDSYFLSHMQLPKLLAEAHPSGDVTKRLGNYEYKQTGDNTYQLCTTFMTAHQDNNKNYYPSSPAYPQPNVEVANPDNHAKGHQCFSYTVFPIQPGLPLKANPAP